MMTSNPSSPPAWQVNPQLRIHLLARVDDGAVLELDDAHGQALRLRSSHHVANLLLQMRSDPEVIARWTTPDAVNPDQPLRDFLLRDCVAHRLLIRSGDAVHASTQNARPAYLSAMWRLLPPRVVNPVAAVLQGLFRTQSIIAVGVLIAFALWSMFAAMGGLLLHPSLSAAEVLWIGACSALGIVLHELGHAAAAYRFGARRVSIGVGLYLVIPVAYSDLSEIWRCSRSQRVVVSLAGVMMQGLWLGALMLAYRATHQYWCLVAAGATAASMLWNLNPFLRMDGYWIMTDAFGVHDLRARARSELLRLWRCLRRREATFSLRPGLLGYALLSAVFLGWLLLRALSFLLEVLRTSLPQVYARFVEGGIAHLDWADWTLAVISLVWQVLMVVVASRFLLTTPQRLRGFFADAARH